MVQGKIGVLFQSPYSYIGSQWQAVHTVNIMPSYIIMYHAVHQVMISEEY